MKQKVEHYIHKCVKCQSTKLVHKKKFELYKPLPIPLGSFENVPMDFMACLLRWKGTDAIFVVVNRFSKLAKIALTQINATTASTTILFFDMWVRHNGIPKVIISD
jgi:hypothetical protein